MRCTWTTFDEKSGKTLQCVLDDENPLHCHKLDWEEARRVVDLDAELAAIKASLDELDAALDSAEAAARPDPPQRILLPAHAI